MHGKLKKSEGEYASADPEDRDEYKAGTYGKGYEYRYFLPEHIRLFQA
jgi:hypothetical protein